MSDSPVACSPELWCSKEIDVLVEALPAVCAQQKLANLLIQGESQSTLSVSNIFLGRRYPGEVILPQRHGVGHLQVLPHEHCDCDLVLPGEAPAHIISPPYTSFGWPPALI